jgi:hypothetical protein
LRETITLDRDGGVLRIERSVKYAIPPLTDRSISRRAENDHPAIASG